MHNPSRRLTLRLGRQLAHIAAVCGTAALIAPGATTANATATPCGPASDPTIAHSGPVRVFADHTHHYVPGFLGYVIACDGQSGVSQILTSVTAAGSYLMPGSVTIRGQLVSYGADVDGASEDEPANTLVQLVNMATNENNTVVEALAVPRQSNPNLGSLGKVMITKIGADGGVAWISCEGGTSIGADLATGRHAVCEKPGREAWVYVATPPAPGQDAVVAPRLVAEGRGITPLSLRLAGSTISWLEHGYRHTARLP